MIKLIALAGSNAGNVIWMKEHLADAALLAGSVAHPGSDEATTVRVRLGFEEEKPFVDDNVRVDIAIRRVDGVVKLSGGWPKYAAIPSRLLMSNMVDMRESGAIIIKIGEDSAKYQAVNNTKSGEIWADLQEITGYAEKDDRESEQTDNDSDNTQAATVSTSNDGSDEQLSGDNVPVEIPDDWEKLHWKKKVKLAEDLTGETPENTAEATTIIKMFAANR